MDSLYTPTVAINILRFYPVNFIFSCLKSVPRMSVFTFGNHCDTWILSDPYMTPELGGLTSLPRPSDNQDVSSTTSALWSLPSPIERSLTNDRRCTSAAPFVSRDLYSRDTTTRADHVTRVEDMPSRSSSDRKRHYSGAHPRKKDIKSEPDVLEGTSGGAAVSRPSSSAGLSVDAAGISALEQAGVSSKRRRSSAGLISPKQESKSRATTPSDQRRSERSTRSRSTSRNRERPDRDRPTSDKDPMTSPRRTRQRATSEKPAKRSSADSTISVEVHTASSEVTSQSDVLEVAVVDSTSQDNEEQNRDKEDTRTSCEQGKKTMKEPVKKIRYDNMIERQVTLLSLCASISDISRLYPKESTLRMRRINKNVIRIVISKVSNPLM